MKDMEQWSGTLNQSVERTDVSMEKVVDKLNSPVLVFSDGQFPKPTESDMASRGGNKLRGQS